MGIDPGTMAIMSLVAGGLQTGMSMLGGMQQAQATAAADNFNAQVAAQNAKIARQQAVWITQAGEAQAAQQEMKTRATVGAIKAAEAASNIDVNSGSAVDVRSSAAELGQLDAITIRSNAAREAYGQQVAATGFTNQSNLDKFAAESASTAGDVGALGTFLGGVGSGTTNFLKFQRAGLLTA